MLPHEEAFSIAEARIMDEARERTGMLDLSGLGLELLPESLFTLHHLRWLDLGSDYGSRLRRVHNQINAQRDRFAELRELEMLSVKGTDLQSIAPFRDLAALQTFDCSNTPVADLAPLSCLAALQWLSCTATQVVDLTPLAGLAALQELNCISTQVSDLTPLSGLARPIQR